MKQFKPIVVIIFLLLFAVIVWTIHIEAKQGFNGEGLFGMGRGGRDNDGRAGGAGAGDARVGDKARDKTIVDNDARGGGGGGHGGGGGQGGGMGTGTGGGNGRGLFHRAAAGAIPIVIGAKMPHPNYGIDCLKCHNVVGGDKKPAIPAGPIAPNAMLIHPFWGDCKKCHKVTASAKAVPAAYINTVVGKNIWGADCITVTRVLAEQYSLSVTSGVLINDVERNSFAATVGFQEGDIVQGINNQPINEVGEMLLALADKNIGDRLTVQVLRNKRKSKNLKFELTQVGISTTANTEKLGIMSAGPYLNSPVSYSFVNAVYLIVYDTNQGTFFAVKNPYRGMPNREVSNWVISQRVGNVIIGNINESDLLNLQQADLKVFGGVFGRNSDAIALYQRGNLIAKEGAQPVALTTNKINVLAIPVNHPDPAANVCRGFETAHYFIKVELDRNKYEVITNPEFGTGKTDGAAIAQFLVDNEVDAVIANRVAADTLIELKKLNVAVYRNVDVSVEDAVLQFQNNKLNPL
ncbi:MAG: PDZ domain-containing protein [Oligoflexia bacterium]|nr:PDZ domain-containing protein [Oligoflexia bacterium]